MSLDEQLDIFLMCNLLIEYSNLDYHLHPSIERTLPTNARIADVGTGTGSYLVELSEKLPHTCSFDGFDVSGDQFRKNTPKNVSLHVQDARDDYPQEFHGKFDVVHLRLLVGGFDKDDWKVATQKTIQLLKPGGAIQWEEANFPDAQHLRSGGKHTSAKTFWKVLSGIQQGLMHRFKWGYNILPDIFQELGLTHVETDEVSSDRVVATRRPLAETSAAGAMGWAKKAGKFSQQEIEELERELKKEVADGAHSRYDIWVAIGFKPVAP